METSPNKDEKFIGCFEQGEFQRQMNREINFVFYRTSVFSSQGVIEQHAP